ncbi:MAG: YjgN family protein [Thermodesulfobacteriota bacterium]
MDGRSTTGTDPVSPQAAGVPAPAPAPVPEMPAAAAEPHRYPFVFMGTGGEYFRIWIVNLLLSILTLGIYSAWAKVRREQYFHRNTFLDGSPLDYHGRPAAILKGRLIAAVLFLALSVAQRIDPRVYLVLLLVLAPIIPWMIVRTFRFRAVNTSYRGLRFDFVGRYRQALTTFVGLPLLVALTGGLLAPYWIRRQKKFVLDHLTFGTSRFSCQASTGGFYRIFGILFLLVFGAVAGMTALAGVLKPWASGAHAPYLAGIVTGLGTLAYLLVILGTVPYWQVATTNHIWNHTRLGEHQFSSSLRLGPYVGIVVTNWLATLVTLGLYWPWAQMRLANYRAAQTSVVVTGSLDRFVAAESAQVTAVGEEMADLFDFDVSL